MSSQQEITGTHLWLLLSRATRSLEVLAQRSVGTLGISLTDFGVLEALLHKGPLPVNEVGRKVLLTSGSITTAIDRLEIRGLVRREQDPEDRRARIVHLTPEGRALIEKLFRQHQRDMEHATSVLTPEEKTVLANGLRRLGRGAESLAADADDESAREKRRHS